MAEISFPVKEQPLSDDQWGQVTLGMGSGILSTGGDPYKMTGRDNASNTLTLGVGAGGLAQAVVQGFYHRIDTAATVSVPAVTATTTYYIGLTYDPAKHGASAGPVSLTVATSVPSGSGKVYLPLYEIARAANQLLTDATVRDRRVYVSPTLTSASQATLPSAAAMLTGTLCTTTDTGTVWRVQDGVWVPANAPWMISPASTAGWAYDMFTGGIEVRYRSDGKRLATANSVYMRRTASGSFTQGSAWMTHATFIPEGLRGGGDYNLFVPAFLQTAGGISPGSMMLNLASGLLSFKLSSGTQTVTTNDAIMFSAAWSTW